MSVQAPRVHTPRLDTDWMDDAACVQMPGLPWIENPGRVPDFLLDLMEAVCDACPVRAQCESFTQTAQITAGFWAGTNRNHLRPHDIKLDDFKPDDRGSDRDCAGEGARSGSGGRAA
jgi:hypothetical protein